MKKMLMSLGFAVVFLVGGILPGKGMAVAEAKTSFEKTTDKIVKKQTKKAKTDEDKWKALFKYMEKNYNYKRMVGFQARKGWEKEYAKEMFYSKKGSCYHFAAAYAYLVKKVGGCQVRICIGQTNGFNSSVWQAHAWCELKVKGSWYVCDPNMDKYAANKSGKYFMNKFKNVKNNYKRSKIIQVKF